MARAITSDEKQTLEMTVEAWFEQKNFAHNEIDVQKAVIEGLAATQRIKTTMDVLGKRYALAYIEKAENEEDGEEEEVQEISEEKPAKISSSNVVGATPAELFRNDIVTRVMAQVEPLIEEKKEACRDVVEIHMNDQPAKVVEGIAHEEFETILAYVAADEPVFLKGPAGCGKNVTCKQVADALGLDFYFSNAVTQEHKLTGFVDAMGVYHTTQFHEAFTKGGLFFLDEMDASIPEVLIILNAAIANRYFDFPGEGRVEAHPNFRVIAAGNTSGLGNDFEYVGRNPLDAASLDRFAQIDMGYSEKVELALTNNDEDLVAFAHDLRDAAERAGCLLIVSYRCLSRIEKMKDVIGLEKALKTGIVKGMPQSSLRAIVSEMSTDNIYTNTLREISE